MCMCACVCVCVCVCVYPYHELVSNMRDAGVRPKMWAIQVGSRGMIDDQSFEPIYLLCKSSISQIPSLKYHLAQIAIRESYMIWCMRNNIT